MFWLWPECLPVWNLWGRLQTQWRYSGMQGQPTGLDYAAVTAYLRAMGYGRGKQRSLPETLDDLTAMEHAVLKVWAERQAMKET